MKILFVKNYNCFNKLFTVWKWTCFTLYLWPWLVRNANLLYLVQNCKIILSYLCQFILGAAFDQICVCNESRRPVWKQSWFVCDPTLGVTNLCAIADNQTNWSVNNHNQPTVTTNDKKRKNNQKNNETVLQQSWFVCDPTLGWLTFVLLQIITPLDLWITTTTMND